MKQARLCIWLVAVLLCCSACGAPSLRYKKDVNRLIASGDFGAAQEQLEHAKNKGYSSRDRLLYQLDSGAVLHDGGQYQESDKRLAAAQDRIDELFTQSVSAHVGRYLINDMTVPYQPAVYERALTYYYRAMNFLSLGDVEGAAVEASRAVFFLDHLSGSEAKEWQNDTFIQYFMSLVFETAGRLDDARIARYRAGQNNSTDVQALRLGPIPDGYGEVVVVHANGVAPLKKSATFQVAWRDVRLWLLESTEGNRNVDPAVQNAISAGILGNAITVAYPVLEKQPFMIKSSEVLTDQGGTYPTRLLGNVEEAAQTDLEDKQAATLFRMALRAATKRVAAVQAKQAAGKASNNENVEQLTEMLFNLLGAVTEKADTRQWFTLPAQWRLTRFYVPAGTQDITLRFKDGFGNIIGAYAFRNIQVKAGERVYLHHRTAK